MEVTKFDMYRVATQLAGFELNDTAALEVLYNLAVMVHITDSGGDIKQVSKIVSVAKKRHPFIFSWSKPTHKENHQI